MCDTTFAFAQRGGHFLQCPSRRDHTRTPKKLQKLLASNQIQRVYHVTLGFENSYLITYRDSNGRDTIASENLPAELDDFIFATNPQQISIRNIPRIRVSLGPYNESFFAGDGSAYVWMNLPPRLLDALQSRIKDGAWTDKPRTVALGVDENFLLVTKNHAAVWDLRHYNSLSQMLVYSQTQANGIKDVHSVVLHPYRYQSFIAQSRNGILIYDNLPDWSMKALKGMRDLLTKDTREAEVRERQLDLQRRPSLRVGDSRRGSGNGRELEEMARLKAQWDNKRAEFNTRSRGLKLSLSLSIGRGGITGGFGKVL